MGFWALILYELKRINVNKSSMVFNFIFLNSFHVVFLYRLSNFLFKKRLKLPARILNALMRIIYSCDISPEATIGEGVILIHGFGIVIGADVIIGKNAKIYNDITIGNRKGQHLDGQATIGDNFTISCGARVLGKVSIGNDVIIGANSVVLKDVPSGKTAVGIPARVN